MPLVHKYALIVVDAFSKFIWVRLCQTPKGAGISAAWTGLKQGSGGSGGSRHSRHYAEFTVLEGWDLYFGVIRPDCDVEHGKNPQNEPESCWYYSANGACYPERNEAWEGILGLDGAGPGTRVGMLLDLTVGSMTVYLNDKRLGDMVEGDDAHGGQQGRRRLHGEYCWAVSMRYSHDAVRIAHVTEPEPPPA